MWKKLDPDLPRVRVAAVAGRFYPGDAQELRSEVERLLQRAAPLAVPAPKAIIAPHAGYLYSGAVAASAYAQLAPEAAGIKRVVLIGPAHYVPFAGIASSTAGSFLTPLGAVPVDMDALETLTKSAAAVPLDEAHEPEHAIEVQLPFLQVVLPEFKIVPLLVGEATAEQVSRVVDLLWGQRETRFVLSSDLSHYLDYDSACELDAATAAAIEAVAPERIGENQACGRLPLCGFLQSAQRHKLHARGVDLRNSADAGGPRDRVVGYGAFGLYED